MAYSYETIICPFCKGISKYQIDIWSNDGVLQVENDYINCNHCNERIYIGNSEIYVLIKAKEPMS